MSPESTAEDPDIAPESAIDDEAVQGQLAQFFSACHAFLGASVAGVVWRRESGNLIHRCSRPSIEQPADDDPLFTEMLGQQETLVIDNLQEKPDAMGSVLLNRALPLKTVVAHPIEVVGVKGKGVVYVGTLVAVQLSKRWVERLTLLTSWAKFIFAVYLLSESQERLEAALEVSEVQAHTDDLTRIWNRKGILQLLEREMFRSEREKLFVSVLFVDLDNLKTLNDEYGHAAGDEAIRCTARTLLKGLRESDAVGRLGGDEFLVVLVDPEHDQMHRVADRLSASLNNTTFEFEGQTLALAASIGVAVTRSGEKVDAEVIIARADEAVYAAKAAGRGQVVRYSEMGGD